MALELAGCSLGRDGRDFERMFRVVALRWRYRFGRRIDDWVLESIRHELLS